MTKMPALPVESSTPEASAQIEDCTPERSQARHQRVLCVRPPIYKRMSLREAQPAIPILIRGVRMVGREHASCDHRPPPTPRGPRQHALL